MRGETSLTRDSCYLFYARIIKAFLQCDHKEKFKCHTSFSVLVHLFKFYWDSSNFLLCLSLKVSFSIILNYMTSDGNESLALIGVFRKLDVDEQLSSEFFIFLGRTKDCCFCAHWELENHFFRYFLWVYPAISSESLKKTPLKTESDWGCNSGWMVTSTCSFWRQEFSSQHPC